MIRATKAADVARFGPNSDVVDTEESIARASAGGHVQAFAISVDKENVDLGAIEDLKISHDG
jgi:hypothetical protein